MDKDKISTFINATGIAATIIACIIAIFMIPFGDVKSYLVENQKWAFPIIVFLSYLCFLIIGLIIGYQYAIKKFKLKKKGFWDLLKKEKNVNEVWVLTSNISYDINNIEFKSMVQENLSKNVKYRYLVPQYSDFKIDVKKYQKTFHLSDEKIKKMFTFYPINEVSKFINNIVIYEPYSNNSETFFFSNVNNEGNDYILLNNDETTYYKDIFEETWMSIRKEKP